MATGSPVKPWERNSTTTQRRPSPLSTTSLPQNTMSSAPSLPSRPSTMAGRSPYSSSSMYGGSSSMYGSSYGGGYGASSYGGGYGASSYGGGYGSSLSRYGGMGGYGSSYGMGGMSGYGSSYGGRGSMYGSRYGGSGFGSSYGGGYGGGYGSTYSRLGMGYDDNSYRNPYPRGKYWSYGSEPELDEFGNPIDDESALQNGKNWLMEMEHVVDGFGHFTRILDYNFDAIHGSFASVIRLFDSFSELRRAIYYGLQGLAIFTLLSKLFAAFQRFLYKLLGKPIPANLSSNFKEAVDSLEDQWSPNVTTARRFTDPANGGKRSSRPLLLLLGFFFVILGGPVILNALYRAFVPRKNVPRPQNLRVKPQVQAIHDFQGQAEGDLSFKKGDIITIRRQVDEGWLEGETSDGVIGLVPITYVQRMRPTRPTPAPGGPGRQVPGVATPPPNVAAGRTNQTPDAVWESTNAPVS